MFKYSWVGLYKHCNGDCNTILNILKYYNGKEVVTTKIANIISKIAKHTKDSYIQDLRGLLEDRTATNNDKCVYLFLASKRNILDQQIDGIECLPIWLASLDVNKLKHNALIELDNDNIYFKY